MTTSSDPDGPLIKDRVSASEWKTRTDLAAFYRLVDHFGWTDLIYNHLSARLPDAPGRYLVNPYGFVFEEITASSLLTVDIAGGEVLTSDQPGREYNEAAHMLHANVLAARPDLMCIAHVHTPAIMAVSAMRCGLLPITQTAMHFHGRLGFHDYGFDENAGARLVRDFGAHDMVILRNHGVLLGAKSIPEAFVQLHNFEFACKAQIAALAGEAHLTTPDVATLAAHSSAIDRWLDRKRGPRDAAGCLEWDACLRLLDRRGVDYAR